MNSSQERIHFRPEPTDQPNGLKQRTGLRGRYENPVRNFPVKYTGAKSAAEEGGPDHGVVPSGRHKTLRTTKQGFHAAVDGTPTGGKIGIGGTHRTVNAEINGVEITVHPGTGQTTIHLRDGDVFSLDGAT